MKSQFGQSEWILKLMETLEIKCGSVFEAGASTPHSISNSRCFIDSGWQAFLVEASSKYIEEWESLSLPNVFIHHKMIEYREYALDQLLTEIKVPSDLDVLFLDIDGSEYQLLQGMTRYRPKVICVEYDNSYPLNINFVPRAMFHSVPSGQASSKAMFLLMQSKGYTYLNSFFLDHIFISNEFIEANVESFEGISRGHEAFAKLGPRNLYDVLSVAINQDENNAKGGILFYSVKLRNLIAGSQYNDAAGFYSMVSMFFHSAISIIRQIRSEVYLNDYLEALARFDDEFSSYCLFH